MASFIQKVAVGFTNSVTKEDASPIGKAILESTPTIMIIASIIIILICLVMVIVCGSLSASNTDLNSDEKGGLWGSLAGIILLIVGGVTWSNNSFYNQLNSNIADAANSDKPMEKLATNGTMDQINFSTSRWWAAKPNGSLTPQTVLYYAAQDNTLIYYAIVIMIITLIYLLVASKLMPGYLGSDWVIFGFVGLCVAIFGIGVFINKGASVTTDWDVIRKSINESRIEDQRSDVRLTSKQGS